MAEYNQNIKVTADVRQAEQQINLLDKKLRGLTANLDLGVRGGRALADAIVPPKTLNQIEKGLSAIINRADTAAKRVARVIEGVGVTAISAKGLSDVGRVLDGLADQAEQASLSLSNLGATQKALIPGFSSIQKGIDALSGSIAGLDNKFSALVPGAEGVLNVIKSIGPEAGAASAAIALIGGVTETLLQQELKKLGQEGTQAIRGITDEVQVLLKELASLSGELGPTLSQLRQLKSKGSFRLENNPVGSPEFRRGASTTAAAQRRIAELEQQITDAVRGAAGLRPTSVENRATNTYNTTQNRKKFLQEQADATKQAAEATRALEQAQSEAARARLAEAAANNAAKLAEQAKQAEAAAAAQKLLNDQMNLAASSTSRRIKEASATVQERKDLERTVALMRERNALELERLRGLAGNPNAYASPAGPGGGRLPDAVEAALAQFQNESALRGQLGKQFAERQALGKQRRQAMELADRELQTELRINAVLQRRTKEQAAAERQAKNRKDVGDRLTNSLVSGAFPLLFGAGPLATAGGFLGGGLGMANPMFGVFTSAIGQVMDQFMAATAQMGSALRDPITNFQRIADAGLMASKSQEFYVRRLIEVGRVSEATGIIQEQVASKIGRTGLNDLTAAGAAADRLSKAWAELNLQMQAALAGPMAGILKWITSILALSNADRRNTTRFNEVRGGLGARDRAAFDRQYNSIVDRTQRGLFFDRLLGRNLTPQQALGQRDALVSQFAGRAAQAPIDSTPRSPEVQTKAAQEQLAAAERGLALRRQGVELERANTEFRRDMEEKVFQFRRRAEDIERANIDLRRSLEDEIFKKRQDIARLEIDNDRRRAQLAIERQDIALNGQRDFTNDPAAQLRNTLLDAVRAYIRAKGEGEADLRQKERTFAVEMEDLKRAAERLRFDVARKVSDIQRQATDYERDVSKAIFQAEQTLLDNRIKAADYELAKAKERLSVETQSQAAMATRLSSQVNSGVFDATTSVGAPSGAANAVLNAANRNLGLFAGITEKCADSMRVLFREAGVAIGVTKKAWDGLSSGGSLASSFFGSDIGQKISNIRDLRPGDLVGFERTYGNWGPGVQTHVGIYAGGGMMFDHSTRRGLTKRPLSTFDGKFMYGVRPYAYGGMAAPMAAAAPANNIVPTTVASAPKPTFGNVGISAPPAPKPADITPLLGQFSKLDSTTAALKAKSLEIDKAWQAMSSDQRLQNFTQVIQGVAQQLTQPIDELLKAQQDQLAYQREYNGLIQDGTLPDLAEEIAGIREKVRLQLELVDASQATYQALIDTLQVGSEERKVLEDKLKLLNAARDSIISGAAAAEAGARQSKSPQARLNAAFMEAKGELAKINDPVAQLVAGANSIGDAFASAFTDVASGAKSAQQALSDAFRSIAANFLQMAAQMMSKWIVLKLLGAFGGGIGGGGGISGLTNNFGFATAGFAEGGFVTGPTPALVGEGDAPEYIIPSDKMASAMANYRSGMRGSAVVSTASSGGSGEVATVAAIDVGYTVERINERNYVTEEQFRLGIRQAAEQGANSGHARSMTTLRNSRSQRTRLGIR